MKEVVTGDNYKQIVLKRMIQLCWILLAVCFVVKLFGGNFFAFIGESYAIEYIAKHDILLIPIQCAFYIFGTYLFYQSLVGHTHKLHTFLLVCILTVFKQLYDVNIYLQVSCYILEFIIMFLYPIIIFECKWYDVIVLNVLLIVFQVLSLITKNIGIISFPYEDVVGFVYMIDYYIMIILLFLHTKKESFTMGKLGLWFLSKEAQQLEEYKKIVVAKHNKKIERLNKKHNQKVNKIDEKIAKC